MAPTGAFPKNFQHNSAVARGVPSGGGPPFGQNHGPYWEPHYSTYIDILAEAQGVPLRGGHFS